MSILPYEAPKVYLFKGNEFEGICYESFKGLENFARHYFTSSSISHWNHRETSPYEWEKRQICIFPGGECSKWNAILSESLQKKILKWVEEQEGRIFAVCAGGYYCSAKSRFTQNCTVIEQTRILNLFQGICQGPLFSNQPEIIKVRWLRTNIEGYVCVIMGGEFVEEVPEVEINYCVLADFPDKSNAAAVIKCRKGKGTAILSSIHWEFGCKAIRPLVSAYPDLASKLPLLKASKAFRKNCLDEIMQALT